MELVRSYAQMEEVGAREDWSCGQMAEATLPCQREMNTNSPIPWVSGNTVNKNEKVKILCHNNQSIWSTGRQEAVPLE